MLVLLASLSSYYETRPLTLTVEDTMSTRTLRAEATARWKKLGTGRFERDGVAVKPADLDHAELLACLIPLLHEARGAELDVVVPDGDRLVPITVSWDRDALRLRRGPALPEMFPPGPARSDVEQRFGVRIAGEWTPAALGFLDGALAELAPEELDRVRGLPFYREVGPPTYLLDKLPPEVTVVEAAYLRDELGPRIEVYDAALRVSGRFVGTPDDPRPFSHMVLLHELGHAVADAPNRARIAGANGLQDEHNRLAAEANELVTRYNALVDKNRLTKAEAAEADALFARVEAIRVRTDALKSELHAASGALGPTDSTPTGRAITGVVPLKKGPTVYARTGPEELLAEGFALFHADPAALKRAAPELYDWFAAGSHLTEPES